MQLTTEVVDMRVQAEFLAEAWRFWQTASEMMSRLELSDVKRLAAKSDYFKECIIGFATQSGLKIDVPQGREFNIGLPLQALNISDFQPDDRLYISQVLQPTVLDTEGKVIIEGKVMVAKQEIAV